MPSRSISPVDFTWFLRTQLEGLEMPWSHTAAAENCDSALPWYW